MNHPGVARIDCGDCQKRLYNLEKGEPVTWKLTPDGPDLFFDGTDHRAPCRRGEKCPKESPEKAHLHMLSVRNQRAVDAYMSLRILGISAFDPFVRDETFAWNMATIDGFFRNKEANASTDSIVNLLIATRR